MKPYFQTLVLLFAAAGMTVSAGMPPMPFAPRAPVPREDVAARVAACQAARAQAVFPDVVPTPAGGSGERAEAFITSQESASASGGTALATSQRATRAVSDPGLITYTYDLMGRRTSMNAAILGASVTYTYDEFGRLETITDHAGGVFGFEYDDLGRRTRLTRPNGVDTEYTYDDAGQLASITHVRDGAIMEKAEYAYDRRGFPIAVTTMAGRHDYTYDDTGQLIAATHHDQPNEAFVYDALGNHTGEGQAVDRANRLLEDNDFTYEYDANGNLSGKVSKTTHEATAYEWDALNRLTAVVRPDSGRVECTYAANGSRLSLTTPEAGEVRFIYDSEDIIAVTDAAGNPLRTFTHGPGIDEPLAVHQAAGATVYHLADILGTVQALTDPTGAVAETYRYTAFGETTVLGAGGIVLASSAFGNPYGFTAREIGPAGVPYFYRARYYDPGLKRFVSEDPIGLDGGDVNVQRYVLNAPAMATDPSGMETCSAASSGNGSPKVYADPSSTEIITFEVVKIHSRGAEFGVIMRATCANGTRLTWNAVTDSMPSCAMPPEDRWVIPTLRWIYDTLDRIEKCPSGPRIIRRGSGTGVRG